MTRTNRLVSFLDRFEEQLEVCCSLLKHSLVERVDGQLGVMRTKVREVKNRFGARAGHVRVTNADHTQLTDDPQVDTVSLDQCLRQQRAAHAQHQPNMPDTEHGPKRASQSQTEYIASKKRKSNPSSINQTKMFVCKFQGCQQIYATKDEAWRRFKEYHQNEFIHSKSFNDHLVELGHDRYPHDLMIPDSESMLTIYAFPDELVYPQLRTKQWFNLEVFNKNQLRETVDLKQLLPESFLNDDLDGNFSVKWVYLSMGSMGSVDLTLMRRIVEALAETNHKYIVSKGPRHGEYDLPRNAWGDRYLPQTKLVPLMDLVITHGGNNTVTETFAHGKPMIVLPLFGDQYDNAQRLHECGFGIRINPYEFDKVQMIEAVNKLLYNHSLKQTLQNAAERIQSSRKHDELALMVEALLEIQKS